MKRNVLTSESEAKHFLQKLQDTWNKDQSPDALHYFWTRNSAQARYLSNYWQMFRFVYTICQHPDRNAWYCQEFLKGSGKPAMFMTSVERDIFANLQPETEVYTVCEYGHWGLRLDYFLDAESAKEAAGFFYNGLIVPRKVKKEDVFAVYTVHGHTRLIIPNYEWLTDETDYTMAKTWGNGNS